MGPYSHFILATKLAPYLQPQNAGEYFWGAIIPDIRYLAKVRREQTHLRQERLKELIERYPHLRSFLLGYQVHCLLDEIDVSGRVGGAFPLNLVQRARRRRFSQQQMTMLVEMYYQQNAAADGCLAGSHNEVLHGLGITPEQSSAFSEAMQGYFRSRSFDAAVTAFQNVGIIENTRLEKYIHAYAALKRSRLMMAVCWASVKNARLEAYAIQYVRDGLRRVE